MADGEDPQHPAVEGPETELDDVREQAHEEAGQRERLAALEGRERELVDRLARLQADFDNFRRRARDEAAQAAGRGKGDLLRALLPALDSLERALAHADDEGLRLVARQWHEALRGAGIEVIDPAGEAFDAKRHEAVAQEAGDAKAGTVLRVLEKGYGLDGRVVRPARVVVAT